MILTDELCDKLCEAAKQKSREMGFDVSFAVFDENGLPRVYRRYGEALALSITLVPGKAYTSAVTQCKTKDVAEASKEGGSLMAIQTNDPRITLVAGGYPLFVNGKIAGGIGVGGGSEEQDCTVAEYVLSSFPYVKVISADFLCLSFGVWYQKKPFSSRAENIAETIE